MPDTQENNGEFKDVMDAEVVNAEIVPAVSCDDGLLHSSEASTFVHPESDSVLYEESLLNTSVSHLSAKGGAVGGVLLAVLGLVGMAFSSYSFFNVLLAILFSIWGLNSPLRKTAIAGLLIALAGLVAFSVTLEN